MKMETKRQWREHVLSERIRTAIKWYKLNDFKASMR